MADSIKRTCRVYCKPCDRVAEPIEREAMGDTYACPGCGRSVELYLDKPTVVMDTYRKPNLEAIV